MDTTKGLNNPAVLPEEIHVAQAKIVETEDAVQATAILQSVVLIVFASGLLVSHLNGNPVSSPAYGLLAITPGWPGLVGLLGMLAGAAAQAVGSLFNNWWTVVAHSAVFLLVGAYSALYISGTILYGGLWGPQALYVGIAVSAGLQARLVTRQMKGVGHNGNRNPGGGDNDRPDRSGDRVRKARRKSVGEQENHFRHSVGYARSVAR